MYSLSDPTTPSPTQLSVAAPPMPASAPEPTSIEMVLAEAVLDEQELEPAYARATADLAALVALARAHWHADAWKPGNHHSISLAIAALGDPTAPHNGDNR
ncbi:MAG: hypothetical protein ACK55O_14330 [Phycisphaerales bacterium]